MYWASSKFLVLLTVLFSSSKAQENAERKIAPGLIECYLDPYLSIKDNLLPHTIETLIELIRKVENAPGSTESISQLSVSLLHRFRQDGIVQQKDVSASSVVLPYSASEYQWGKHHLILKKLLPGNAVNFPNVTLSAVERCTLHSMLSSSVNYYRRGDEGQVCNKLANYRALRVPREIQQSKYLKKVAFGDLDDNEWEREPRNSDKLRMDENEDYGDEYDDTNVDTKEHVDTINFAAGDISECPVENGVVKTIWGTISPGNVISGIATGLQNQKVPLSLLMGGKRRSNQQNFYVDNRWASTLSGDLAEVLLRQVAPNPNNINIGAPGAWNSSALPKWYFLTQREKYEMTDAEIRGGIDGLIIAQNIKEWQGKAPNLKLSQVLEMYYSQKGVLDSGIKACDRKKSFAMVKPDELKKQTAAFAKLLQDFVARVTIKDDGFGQLSDLAVNALLKYVSESLNDVSCESSTPNPNLIDTEISTDLIIFIDTAWPYKEIKDLVGYILTQINLNVKASSVAMFDASEANNISSTTSDLSTVFESWNAEDYQRRRQGISLSKVFTKLLNVTSDYLNYEKGNSSAGGSSLVGLIIPYTSGINEGDSNSAWERLQILRDIVPDVRILFFSQGPVARFERFVIDKKKDLIPAQSSSDPVSVAKPIIDRIKELSRRIINPRCGVTWDSSETGIISLKQCVSPGSTKYYRLIPNYFFSENGNRKLKIQSPAGTSTITVCVTRRRENPRSNVTIDKPDDLDCKQIITNAFELDLRNPCYDFYEINKCDPYYISVEASEDVGNGNLLPDPDCKNPNDIPFKITSEHLTCHSGVDRLLKNGYLLIILFSYFLVISYRS
ncbi:uncharacterized protein LOC129606331 [Condylostylus longicornis]|uniref:uncharacterized protein LOC129606331 n=1 Tax=Condylostylus longicornis TaxID=2530218 RepID=UPI00244DD176|nr:uncharacterized protein LOC129606331 [Condylostylus longicornis]